MATATRIDQDVPAGDTRDVQLVLSAFEAQALRTLLYTRVAGTGPDRKTLDTISDALSSAGVMSQSVKHKFAGMVACE